MPAFDLFSALFAAAPTVPTDALSVILGLIIIEGLLSVDNALAIAAMSTHLDPKRRALAMNLGYAGAYGFRILALVFATYIVGLTWVMFLGAAYLVWLMCSHFVALKEVHSEVGETLGDHAHSADEAKAIGHAAGDVVQKSFASTITMIALMDLSLSVDNVVTAWA